MWLLRQYKEVGLIYSRDIDNEGLIGLLVYWL
jgi:hypothetical protein